MNKEEHLELRGGLAYVFLFKRTSPATKTLALLRRVVLDAHRVARCWRCSATPSWRPSRCPLCWPYCTPVHPCVCGRPSRSAQPGWDRHVPAPLATASPALRPPAASRAAVALPPACARAAVLKAQGQKEKQTNKKNRKLPGQTHWPAAPGAFRATFSPWKQRACVCVCKVNDCGTARSRDRAADQTGDAGPRGRPPLHGRRRRVARSTGLFRCKLRQPPADKS